MGAGVTKEGVLQTDGTGGSSTSVAIGQPINATDAAVLNTAPTGTEYGLVVRVVGGGGGGGGAVTVADGADVTQGAIADAAVITDTTGTLSGKLRGLVKWAYERMPASLGQKLMAASFPVVISSDQSVIPVDASGSVVITGGLTDTQLRATPVPVSGPLTDTQLRASAVPISAASLPLPTGAATETTLSTRLADATFTGRINTLGQKTAANSTPVVLASDQSSIPVSATETRPATSSISSVAGSASSVTLLASNANRRLATIFNDSTAILYVKFGATASTSSYTVQMGPSAYFEIPQPVYSGIIDGIWASATGNARITELT